MVPDGLLQPDLKNILPLSLLDKAGDLLRSPAPSVQTIRFFLLQLHRNPGGNRCGESRQKQNQTLAVHGSSFQ